MKLNVNDCRQMVCFIADKVIENKSLLTEMDSAIGDGDHGIGMSGGMAKVKSQIDQLDTDNAYQIFKISGNVMLMSMGGASGILFGSMFMAGAKGAAKELGTVDLAEMFAAGLAAVKTRGKASVGDKTMVDALEPAVTAMKDYSGASMPEMMKNARDAAYKGMESTKSMVAKFGRAKTLMERAVGHQDAGATSVWIIFSAMYEWACGNSKFHSS